MDEQIKYFDKDVWVTSAVFHYNGTDLPLAKIESIYINFRVNTTIMSAFAFLVSLAGLGYCYFKFDDWAYLWLIPIVASFGLTRHMLNNYVELMIRSEGRTIKTVVTPMRRRTWAYELEEHICALTGLEIPQGSASKK